MAAISSFATIYSHFPIISQYNLSLFQGKSCWRLQTMLSALTYRDYLRENLNLTQGYMISSD